MVMLWTGSLHWIIHCWMIWGLYIVGTNQILPTVFITFRNKTTCTQNWKANAFIHWNFKNWQLYFSITIVISMNIHRHIYPIMAKNHIPFGGQRSSSIWFSTLKCIPEHNLYNFYLFLQNMVCKFLPILLKLHRHVNHIRAKNHIYQRSRSDSVLCNGTFPIEALRTWLIDFEFAVV